MTHTLPISRDHAPRTAPTRTVSHHWFRRTARTHAKKLRAAGVHATVMRSRRGPYAWSVVVTTP